MPRDNKKLKHERTKARAKVRKAKRKKKKELRATKRSFAELQIDNISAQVQEQQQPTFDKSAFQALKPPDNTNDGVAAGRVLTKKKRKAGFDRGVWGPPDEQDSEV